jgi:hypothetical protein
MNEFADCDRRTPGASVERVISGLWLFFFFPFRESLHEITINNDEQSEIDVYNQDEENQVRVRHEIPQRRPDVIEDPSIIRNGHRVRF